MKKYPIGIQHFEKLRDDGYLYVDKTKVLYQLLQNGGYYFLSRPRRFGKSLTLSTLKAVFEGKKHLFDGLWIADHYAFEETFPVIHLELNKLGHKEIGLAPALHYQLDRIAEQFGISLHAPSPGLKLEELVMALSAINRVVVLIDEYDKPVLDYLEDTPKAEETRDALKSFYAPLKALDPHLRFVLLTGVSKFSRMSIFSELNNLEDLTLHPGFAALTGYTQDEMALHFSQEVEEMAQAAGVDAPAMWDKVKHWYNGYTWDGKTKVYNPFSVLCLFKQHHFANFWFQTGTPTFLVKLLRKALPHYHEGAQITANGLDSFELGRISPVTLMFQTGYLTITAWEDQVITLDYPNQEVREALTDHLLVDMAYVGQGEASMHIIRMAKAIRKGDIEEFMHTLDALFAQIPHAIFLEKAEAYYHTVLYLAFGLLGYHVQCERPSRHGRSDLALLLPDKTYVMEFKLDRSAQEALQQIRDKGYAQPYLGQNREVVLVGVNFSSAKKGIEEWKTTTP